MKKILILTTLAGIGHYRAAWAVEEGIKKIHHDPIEIRTEDPLSCLCFLFPFILNSLYLSLLHISPSLWGMIYNNEVIPSKYSPIRWMISLVYGLGILKILKKFSPDIIVCTHVFAVAGVERIKRRGRIDIPLIALSTDYHYHPLGINEQVDTFVVACEEILEYLVGRGVPKEKIKVCGISVSPKFSEHKNKNLLRERFRIGEGDSVILVMSGGFGVGPVKRLIKSFSLTLSPIHLLIVAGKNQRLKSTLQRMVDTLEIKAHVFGFVENMEDFMEAADIVITKPGGLSVAESLIKGLPLIVTPPIKGQETWNVKYLMNKDAAILLQNESNASFIVSSLFAKPWRLRELKDNSKKAAKPNATIEVAKLILNSIKRKEGEN